MNRNEFVGYVAAAARKRRETLTPKQATIIGERVAQLEDDATSPLWNYQDQALRDSLIDRALAKIEEAAPELHRVPPTVEQYVALQAKAFEERQKRPWRAVERLIAQRAAAELSPDELLARVPADAKLPEVKPPTQLSTPLSKPMPADVAAFDAEIEARTGKKPGEMFPSERRRWHDQIRGELAQDASSERNREAAAASIGGDLSKLSPAARITAHRRGEKAKNRA